MTGGSSTPKRRHRPPSMRLSFFSKDYLSSRHPINNLHSISRKKLLGQSQEESLQKDSPCQLPDYLATLRRSHPVSHHTRDLSYLAGYAPHANQTGPILEKDSRKLESLATAPPPKKPNTENANYEIRTTTPPLPPSPPRAHGKIQHGDSPHNQHQPSPQDSSTPKHRPDHAEQREPQPILGVRKEDGSDSRKDLQPRAGFVSLISLFSSEAFSKELDVLSTSSKEEELAEIGSELSVWKRA